MVQSEKCDCLRVASQEPWPFLNWTHLGWHWSAFDKKACYQSGWLGNLTQKVLGWISAEEMHKLDGVNVKSH